MNYGQIRARLVSLTGWTWEYVGRHMTLPRLYELEKYWDRHPPVGDLVAGLMGFKAPAIESTTRYGDLSDLISCVRGAGGQVIKH